jgi:hypothetical protein
MTRDQGLAKDLVKMVRVNAPPAPNSRNDTKDIHLHIRVPPCPDVNERKGKGRGEEWKGQERGEKHED